MSINGKNLLVWPFKRRNWALHTERAIHCFLTLETVDEIHSALMAAGVREEDATKLLLFVPSAFAREMFEPEGVVFSDNYIYSRSRDQKRRVASYLEEPIYLHAREAARKLIEADRFTDLRIVIAWSAEGTLVQQAIEQGLSLHRVRFSEITCNF